MTASAARVRNGQKTFGAYLLLYRFRNHSTTTRVITSSDATILSTLAVITMQSSPMKDREGTLILISYFGNRN